MNTRAPDRWFGARVCTVALMLGLGGGAHAGPGVDMAQTLDALATVGHDPYALILRMAEIYGDVRLRNLWVADGEVDKTYAPYGSAHVALELRKQGEPVATAGCDRFGPDDHDLLQVTFRNDASRFCMAARTPVSQGVAHRVVCYVHLWDRAGPLAAAQQDVVQWGAATIGGLTADGVAQTAVNVALEGSGKPWAMTMRPDPGADIPAMVTVFIYEVPAAPS